MREGQHRIEFVRLGNRVRRFEEVAFRHEGEGLPASFQALGFHRELRGGHAVGVGKGNPEDGRAIVFENRKLHLAVSGRDQDALIVVMMMSPERLVPMMVIVLLMRMRMSVPVVMMVVGVPMIMPMSVGVGVAKITPRPEKHPDRQGQNTDRRTNLQVRLHGLSIPLTAKMQRRRREDPNQEGMGKRGREPEQNGLPDRSPNRDDEGGHHRFGVTRFKTVQRAQENGRRNEEPQIVSPVL